jgi:hypothetical protein
MNSQAAQDGSLPLLYPFRSFIVLIITLLIRDARGTGFLVGNAKYTIVLDTAQAFRSSPCNKSHPKPSQSLLPLTGERRTAFLPDPGPPGPAPDRPSPILGDATPLCLPSAASWAVAGTEQTSRGNVPTGYAEASGGP